MPLALSTGHEVGLGVTAAAFIAFAIASAFLFPRIRPNYPGGGLLAFVVVAFLFFFGMLTAQAAVIVSTFAMAARQRNLLWSLAAAAGLIAIALAIYVYLFV